MGPRRYGWLFYEWGLPKLRVVGRYEPAVPLVVECGWSRPYHG